MTTNDPYAGERPKLTAFYPRAKELNIRDAWQVWNGYKFAECYYDGEYEYFCEYHRFMRGRIVVE